VNAIRTGTFSMKSASISVITTSCVPRVLSKTKRVLDHSGDHRVGEQRPATDLEEAIPREVTQAKEQERVRQLQGGGEGEQREGDAERRVLRKVCSEIDDTGGDRDHRRGADLGHRRQTTVEEARRSRLCVCGRRQLASLVMITSVATCMTPVMPAV